MFFAKINVRIFLFTLKKLQKLMPAKVMLYTIILLLKVMMLYLFASFLV